MRENYQPRYSDEHVTDAEIAAVIRYLDPDGSSATSSANRDAAFVMCFSLIGIVAGVLAYIWLYFRTL
jgi:hypothetical protein